MVRRLVTDPGAFYTERLKYPGLGKPIAIVAIVGIALALEGVAVGLALGGAATEVQSGLIVMIGVRFLQGVLLWIAFVIALYALATVQGGRPSIGGLFKLTAWGLLPLAAAGVVWSLGRYVSLRGRRLPGDVRTGYLSAEWSALQEFAATSADDPVNVVATLLGAAIVLVAGYLLVPAVETDADLDRRAATIAVAVPVGLYLAWTLAARLP